MGDAEKTLANAETDGCRQGWTGRLDPSGAGQQKQTLRVLDLFSGIGGFSLGLERAGMRTVAFCEIDPYCRKVLAKHWPNIPCYDDVTTLTAARLAADGILVSYERRIAADAEFGREHSQKQILTGREGPRLFSGIDAICGGFPCQDISVAGKGAGIEGSRSGLWSEYARIIGEVRPRYVIVENVAALLGRGLERVLGDLAALGFDAEWHCIPASAVGAPHRRDRVWIVAYPQEPGWGEGGNHANGVSSSSGCDEQSKSNRESISLADTGKSERGWGAWVWGWLCGDQEIAGDGWRESWETNGQWLTEPNVGRVAHGVPARVDRLRSLGNAIVPQIPEIIGRAIMEIERLLPVCSGG